MAIQSQLYGGSPEWFDNGCSGVNPFQSSFDLQQLQQQQYHQQLLLHLQSEQQRNESLFLDSSCVLKNTNQEIMRFMEKQKQELDYYIRSQNERLRLLLQEQRKQQTGLLMKKLESRAVLLLRQKDEEISRAATRTMELQNLLKNLEMENQAWQRVAQDNEAMVESLNIKLDELKERDPCVFNNDAEDAESCWEGTEEDEELRKQSMICKCCNFRNSSVLLLPCRHLCSCKDCAVLLDSCPVCGTVKKDSIEVLFSLEEDASVKFDPGYHQNKKRKFDDCNFGGDELQPYQFVR